MSSAKRFFANLFLAGFIGIVLFIARANCIVTLNLTHEVESFFERTRTIQVAQSAADRAMFLVEDKTRQYNDLEGQTKALVKNFTRLSFKHEDAIMRSTIQTEYIRTLEKTLRDNQIPLPEPSACPNPTDVNSFNLQRPMIPMPNALPRLQGGSSQRNSTEQDVSGTADSHEA